MDLVLLNLLVQILFLIIFIVLFLYIGFILVSFKNLVPYVPTPRKITKKMIELADLKEGDKVCDLGSGSGEIIFQTVKKYPVIVTGIEKSKILYWISKIKSLYKGKRGKILTKNEDFLKSDLSQFDVIFCFLITRAMEKLEPNFNRMKIGSKIISYKFPLKSDCFREKIITIDNKEKIFIYQKIN